MKFSVLAGSCFAFTTLALLGSAFSRPSPVQIVGQSAGEITTLYANDPLECMLSFRTGEPGLVMQEAQVFNRDSHVALGYHPDSLTLGVQGGDTGAIVDLGTLQEVGKSLSLPRVGNDGNAYAALQLPWVREHTGLKESESTAHAPIRTGHVYLGRIVDSDEPDLFVKLLVLEFRPGESVTFRWERLEE